MTNLRLRLADGSEVEATLESSLTGGLRELLATGYHGNQMHIAADEADDVAGHSFDATTVHIRLYDEDDTEGQAMTLRLPNAEAARDLQRKLLKAGLAGVIVVGAATTAVWMSENATSVGTGAQAVPVAAPAPAWANPAVRDRGAEDVVAPIVAPAAANPAVRDRGAEDVVAPIVAPAAANPAVRDRGAEDVVAPDAVAPLTAPAAANPAVRDRDGGTSTSTDRGDQATPGGSRLR